MVISRARGLPKLRVAVVTAAALSVVGGAQAATSPTEVSGTEISVLVRSTVVALDQANRTGNYSVVHDLGDGSFRGAYSQAALADMFRAFRDQNVALNSVVLFDAQLDAPPQLTQDGYLRVLGHFPTLPNEVIFDITYRFEDGPWRIDGISVGMRKPPAASPEENKVSELRPPVEAPLPAPRPKWRDDAPGQERQIIKKIAVTDDQPIVDEGL